MCHQVVGELIQDAEHWHILRQGSDVDHVRLQAVAKLTGGNSIGGRNWWFLRQAHPEATSASQGLDAGQHA